MALLEKLKIPANSQIFTEFMVGIIKFDLYPTYYIDDEIYYFPDEEPFSINFEACGIESKLFVPNLGSVFWTTLILLVVALTSLVGLVHKKVRVIWNKLGKKIYWNSTIRLFMELFVELVFLAILNIDTADWGTLYPSENYSNIFSVVILVILLATTLFLVIYVIRRRN